MPTRPVVHGAPRRQREYRERRTLEERKRLTPAQRGYTTRWAKAAKGYLAKHPLCRECEKAGRVTLATEADHIIPHCLSEALASEDEARIARARHSFWDFDRNVQPLCRPCHSRKTASQDGGFGNFKS